MTALDAGPEKKAMDEAKLDLDSKVKALGDHAEEKPGAKEEKENEASKQEEIKKLEIQIETTEQNLESTLDGSQEEIAALMDQSQKKVGFNLGLRSLLTKLRQENRVQYNNQIAKMSDGDQKGEAEDAAKNAQEKADKAGEDLEEIKDANKDKPESKKAATAIKTGDKGAQEELEGQANQTIKDKVGEPENKPAEVSGTSVGKTPEEKAAEAAAAEKALKDAKLKELDDKIEDVKAGIPNIKNKEAKEVAKTTVVKLKDAKEKVKESLEFGMDPELFENEIWALNAVLEITKRKIDTDLYDNL